ncbi:uncharacterized protein CLUP02_01517 [Colletotrichum lupini]|uniref:Uncharacterized protein n=1 Tax=Colletotrichum lupini TaxID=145971 RepID=A0A9Q8SCV1_9PEZI|nr:uncharacterized protein CLUP02_01517 [Colletotrichum lupini]UQC74865.1 hypothetical protein CLUP02_01517 [Colletotrichum lupini]
MSINVCSVDDAQKSEGLASGRLKENFSIAFWELTSNNSVTANTWHADFQRLSLLHVAGLPRMHSIYLALQIELSGQNNDLPVSSTIYQNPAHLFSSGSHYDESRDLRHLCLWLSLHRRLGAADIKGLGCIPVHPHQDTNQCLVRGWKTQYEYLAANVNIRIKLTEPDLKASEAYEETGLGAVVPRTRVQPDQQTGGVTPDHNVPTGKGWRYQESTQLLCLGWPTIKPVQLSKPSKKLVLQGQRLAKMADKQIILKGNSSSRFDEIEAPKTDNEMLLETPRPKIESFGTRQQKALKRLEKVNFLLAGMSRGEPPVIDGIWGWQVHCPALRVRNSGTHGIQTCNFARRPPRAAPPKQRAIPFRSGALSYQWLARSLTFCLPPGPQKLTGLRTLELNVGLWWTSRSAEDRLFGRIRTGLEYSQPPFGDLLPGPIQFPAPNPASYLTRPRLQHPYHKVFFSSTDDTVYRFA